MSIDISVLNAIKKYGISVISTSEFMQTINFVQHGATNCFLHCIAVAYISFKIINFLKLNVNKYELTRSALLHDYFLYDWHDGRIRNGKIHGFTHPKIACENAIRDFDINENEYKNIKSHMWPMTIVPPTKKEGWIITLADKFCAIYEIFHRKKTMLDMKTLENYGLLIVQDDFT